MFYRDGGGSNNFSWGSRVPTTFHGELLEGYLHWRIQGCARDVCPHGESKFFHFRVVFGKKFTK